MSWLCRDDMDRERLLDMEERFKPVRRLAMGILAVALLVGGPWIGFWTLIPLVAAAGFFALADARLERSEHPEYLIFAAWTASELTIAAAVVLSGGPAVVTISWLAIPVVTLSARFPLRGVVAGVAIAVSLCVGVAFALEGHGVVDNPTIVTAPLALIVAIAVLSTALMHSDLQHRGEAVIDQLTGMLNRKALDNRISELCQQSEVSGQPIGVILGDIDHFKLVNDSGGHAAGDAVLTDLAYTLRKQLRAFDLAYRIGGEEFLVLVPGADIPECEALAELLRRTVEACTFGDAAGLTMSFGVSASVAGDTFDYERVFAAADEALYEAKSIGRNRVCTAELVEHSQDSHSAQPQAHRAAASATS